MALHLPRVAYGRKPLARCFALCLAVFSVTSLMACMTPETDEKQAEEVAPVIADEGAVIDLPEPGDVIDIPVEPAAKSVPAGLPATDSEDGQSEATPTQALSAMIFVDNLPVVALPDRDEAQAVLDELKAQYGVATLGGELKSVEFLEKVDVLEQGDAVTAHDAEDAMLKLVSGGKDGESILHVMAVETLKVSEAIPFKTETVNDATMNSGTSKTLTAGKEGKGNATYDVVLYNGKEHERKRISLKVVEQPVNQVVAKGTKAVASGKPGPNEGVAGPSSGSLSFSYPISGRTSSYFGMRNGKMHYGIDILGSTGTQIKASESGTVTISETRGDYGLLVEIKHSDGFTTRYAHCSKLLVTVGQHVSKGDVVALVGNTGNSSAPHVHFEVRAGNVAYNPMQYLK